METKPLKKLTSICTKQPSDFTTAFLLVVTLYSPKSHRLNFLRSLCEDHEPQLVQAWPRATKFGRRCFDLLRRAYVEARYSPHYKIKAEELSWLMTHLERPQDLVREICESRLVHRTPGP